MTPWTNVGNFLDSFVVVLWGSFYLEAAFPTADGLVESIRWPSNLWVAEVDNNPTIFLGAIFTLAMIFTVSQKEGEPLIELRHAGILWGVLASRFARRRLHTNGRRHSLLPYKVWSFFRTGSSDSKYLSVAWGLYGQTQVSDIGFSALMALGRRIINFTSNLCMDLQMAFLESWHVTLSLFHGCGLLPPH